MDSTRRPCRVADDNGSGEFEGKFGGQSMSRRRRPVDLEYIYIYIYIYNINIWGFPPVCIVGDATHYDKGMYTYIYIYIYIYAPMSSHRVPTSFLGLATFQPSCSRVTDELFVHDYCTFRVTQNVGRCWCFTSGHRLNFRHLPTWEFLFHIQTNNSFKGGGFHTNYFWVILITN